MQGLALGFLIGLIVLPLFGLLYFRFGYAPVATASSPMPFEKQLAHMALNARIRKEAPKNAPLQANDETFMAGARVIEHIARYATDYRINPHLPYRKACSRDRRNYLRGMA